MRAVHYGLIALAAWAAAVVVVKLTGLDLEPKAASTPLTTDVAKAPKPTKRGNDEAVILKRNIFGATDLEVADEESPVAAGGADLRLRGIASSKGASFAVFENTSSGEQNVFAIGEKVFDGPKLVAVDLTGAEVLLKGRKKRYEIEEDELASLPSEDGGSKRGKGLGKNAGRNRDKPEKAKQKLGKNERSKKGDAGGVKKTGEGNYLVDRREVEQAVSNLNEVITEVRAVPVLQEGKSSGFKLFNIQRGSIFDKLGLLDGDIVQRVNDTELTDPSKAVGLLEEVQSMGQIRVNFVRGGKQRSYTYTIQ